MENRSIPSDDPATLGIDKTEAKKMGRRPGVLGLPLFPSVLCPKDRAIVADHPSLQGIQELHSAQAVFAAAVLHRPAFTAVFGMQDQSFLSYDPTLLGIDEKDPVQILLGPGHGRDRSTPRGTSRNENQATDHADKESDKPGAADRSGGPERFSSHFIN
jgi:hypothetical protein